MLKLERTKPCSDVTITLQSREKLFTKGFRNAFVLTLLLHLLAIFLFKIPDYLNNTKYDPQLVTVASASGNFIEIDDMLNSNRIDQNGMLPRIITAPAEHYPTLPSSPASFVTQARTDYKPALWLTRDFDQIEEINLHIHDSYTALPTYFAPTTINLIGGLSSYELDLSLNEQSVVRRRSTVKTRVVFDVLAQGKPGRVFWLAQDGGLTDRDVEEKAERIIKNLSFSTGQTMPITRGKIEIIFEREEAI